MPNSHDTHTEYATVNNELLTAFIGMSNGITRPKPVQRKLEDAARGRLRNPLGSYPVVAQACLDSGGSFYHATRPLSVMLAHLRRRYRKLSGADFRAALIEAKRESDEAEVCAFGLALSVNGPEASALIAQDKEASEAILAWEKVRELSQDRLAALEAR